jgi:predicted RNase H-like HicB family nuclease
VVTVAGKPGDDLAAGTLNSVLKQAGLKSKKYLIVIEETATGFSAYSRDLPGCISTGAAREDVEENMREAMAFHLDGLREEGEPVPEPRTYSTYVELPA